MTALPTTVYVVGKVEEYSTQGEAPISKPGFDRAFTQEGTGPIDDVDDEVG